MRRRRAARTPSRPPVIGLTGTIGAGKSTALAAFARHGCAVLDADAVVHALYRSAAVRDSVVARLGPGVLGRDGVIDRRAVARAIFADEELRAWLESYIHPLVHDAALDWRRAALQAVPPPRALVEEVQLLFEGDRVDGYDRTLVVTTSPEIRRARLVARGRIEGLAAREARLLPEDEKAALADDVIVNDGDVATLDRAVVAYLDRVAPR
jgi:dephospho-CoA kinase